MIDFTGKVAGKVADKDADEDAGEKSPLSMDGGQLIAGSPEGSHALGEL